MTGFLFFVTCNLKKIKGIIEESKIDIYISGSLVYRPKMHSFKKLVINKKTLIK